MLTLLTSVVAVFALNANVDVPSDQEISRAVLANSHRRTMRKNAVLAKMAEDLGEEGGFDLDEETDLDPEDFEEAARVPTRTYVRKVAGCVNGQNIKLYRNKSVAQCKAICDRTSNCKAFEYGVNYGGKNTKYRGGDCQPQKSADMANCDGRRWNLDLYYVPLYRIPPKQLPSHACPRCVGKHCVSTCWWNNPHDKWCHAHEKGRQCWKNNRYYRCKKHNWASQYWKHEYCK